MSANAPMHKCMHTFELNEDPIEVFAAEVAADGRFDDDEEEENRKDMLLLWALNSSPWCVCQGGGDSEERTRCRDACVHRPADTDARIPCTA
jgi:hypothetical protein